MDKVRAKQSVHLRCENKIKKKIPKLGKGEEFPRLKQFAGGELYFKRLLNWMLKIVRPADSISNIEISQKSQRCLSSTETTNRFRINY
jgi:hypothetical protein